MTDRRKKPAEPAKAEVVEEKNEQSLPEIRYPTSDPETALDDEASTSDVAAFNKHIRDLVGLFVEQKIQGLEQRITDLEMLVGNPAESLVIEYTAGPRTPTPEIPAYGADQRVSGQDGVQWYQPD